MRSFFFSKGDDGLLLNNGGTFETVGIDSSQKAILEAHRVEVREGFYLLRRSGGLILIIQSRLFLIGFSGLLSNAALFFVGHNIFVFK